MTFDEYMIAMQFYSTLAMLAMAGMCWAALFTAATRWFVRKARRA